MISIVVDSSVWIDFLAGRSTWQALNLRGLARRGEPIGLTDVVLTELLQGADDDADLARLEDYLAAFEVAKLESLDDFRLAAALHRAGRKAGRHSHPSQHGLPHRRGMHQGGPSTAA